MTMICVRCALVASMLIAVSHPLHRDGDYVIPRLINGLLKLDNRMPQSPYSTPVPGQTDMVFGNAIVHQIDFILLSPFASAPPPPAMG